MAYADGGMQVDQRGGAARLRKAVGRRDHHRLLQSKHVAEVGREIAEHRQLRGTGIAEHRGQPEFAQQRECRVAYRDFAAVRTRAWQTSESNAVFNIKYVSHDRL